MQELWEILVPRNFNDGKEVSISHHNIWDEYVHDISGGLTILKLVRGRWSDAEGKLFSEEMIPVRIACTREQILKIIDFAICHYSQHAVMAYKISEDVLIVEKK